ncbi:uncharacterized protein PADG_03731 [Paracoccidioides brasiliensis Pb18]|uniref:C6 finger domain transcription factor nscR n=1 Tax=Paracoccidioides brasiliensis (strain Pb18) TaxID=502780 RepID=C1G8Z5_PARBD|nr:uncharacterized protein PADG_03731 [Paracoccidioides brasiliensis Pb18]EEH47647.2 hypothetical protein PADG_03731 [Paracoccidioides brasiliensis Pb18]
MYQSSSNPASCHPTHSPQSTAGSIQRSAKQPENNRNNDYFYGHVGANRSSGESGPVAGANESSSPSPAAPAPTPTLRIRRRNRMITSCLECRRRKLKCDRLHPCTKCSKSNRDCLFLAPAWDENSRKKLADLKDRMGSLERALEHDAAQIQASRKEGGQPDGDGQAGSNTLAGMLENSAEAQAPVPEDEVNLVPTPLAVQDAGYEDGSDDDNVDLGFKLGKLRLTDRIGGLYRPKVAEELAVTLNELSMSDKLADRSNPKSSRIWKLMPKDTESYFAPGPSYIAPCSDFIFGCGSQRYTLIDFLPSRPAADRLLQQYWEAVDPIAKVSHRPTVEKQYNDFWLQVSRGVEPPYSVQAVIFAAMFSAAISMTEDSILSTFGVAQNKLTENFQLATETALGKANFLRTTKTQTIQASVMYMIPMCRGEVSRAHSVLVGTIIRLAECMGFHRDPGELSLDPIETHVRRMIWYQLCFLDIRTVEAQGPRLSIRREDFSTKFPLNVDDNDLRAGAPTSLNDKPYWTDMTFTRLRFECHELQRLVNIDRLRVEQNLISLTHVLGKIEAFRRATLKKYSPLIDVPNPKPIQRAAQLFLSLYINRAYIALLHRYHHNTTVRIPDRLMQIILTTGVQMTEDAIALETQPELRPWYWYSTAFSQWHTALLLLIDIFNYPLRKEADRIWRCLYYVFEISPSPFELGGERYSESNRRELLEDRHQKGRMILGQLKDRMICYRARRKLKIPANMQGSQIAEDLDASTSGRKREILNNTVDFGYPATQEGYTAPVSLVSGAAQTPPGACQTSRPPSQSQPPSTVVCSQTAESYQDVNVQNQHAATSHWQQQPLQSNPPLLTHSHQIPPIPQQQHAQPLQLFSYGPLQHLQTPKSMTDYADRVARGQSLDSETNNSEDSGSTGLWFYPGVGSGTAGAAPPPLPPNGKLTFPDVEDFPKGDSAEDLPLLDIDWVSLVCKKATSIVLQFVIFFFNYPPPAFPVYAPDRILPNSPKKLYKTLKR